VRRADRLFQIVQLLRGRRLTTAAWLADELEVSPRTVYRDIRDLICSGVPIDGEAGVGYTLPSRFDLPPLMFSRDEIEAMVLGARVVEGWADAGLVAAARSALRKIEAVIPERLRPRLERSRLFAVNFSKERAAIGERLAALRRAVDLRLKVQLSYAREDGEKSARVVWPLCLAFFGPNWLLTAWCELRDDFRNFRLDRINAIELLEEPFEEQPGRSLEDFFKRILPGR
jgi:predicted DNA-binding transcriptional regulator YafY